MGKSVSVREHFETMRKENPQRYIKVQEARIKLQKEKINELQSALLNIYKVLGPTSPNFMPCAGALFEWNEALSIARQFTPIDDLYDTDKPEEEQRRRRQLDIDSVLVRCRLMFIKNEASNEHAALNRLEREEDCRDCHEIQLAIAAVKDYMREVCKTVEAHDRTSYTGWLLVNHPELYKAGDTLGERWLKRQNGLISWFSHMIELNRKGRM